jgi:hypothetical protein
LANSLITEGIDSVLLEILRKSKQVAAIEATAWALGQMGKHTPQIASSLIHKSAIDILYGTYTAARTEELRSKTREALKLLIRQSADVAEISPYIATTQLTVQRYVLQQIAQIITANEEMRRAFLGAGGIAQIAALGPPADMDEKARAAIQQINELARREPEPEPEPVAQEPQVATKAPPERQGPVE